MASPQDHEGTHFNLAEILYVWICENERVVIIKPVQYVEKM